MVVTEAKIEALKREVPLNETISKMVRMTGDLDLQFTEGCFNLRFESLKTGQVYEIDASGLYRVCKDGWRYKINKDEDSWIAEVPFLSGPSRK